MWKLTRGEQEWVFRGHEGNVNAVAISPDGNLIASGGFDNRVLIYDFATRQDRLSLPLEGYVDMRSIAFSPDGKWLAARDPDNINIWQTETWEKMTWLPGARTSWNYNNGITFSPDSKFLVARFEGIDGKDSGLGLYNLETKTIQLVPKPQIEEDIDDEHFGKVTALSRDGQYLAAEFWNDLFIFRTDDLQLVATLKHDAVGPSRVMALDISDELIAAGYRDGTMRIWAVGTWSMIDRVRAHPQHFVGLAFSPEGNLIATGADDRFIHLWQVPPLKDFQSGRSIGKVSSLVGHTRMITGLTFTPDSTHLLSSSEDRTIRAWRIPASLSGTEGPNQALFGHSIRSDRTGIVARQNTGDLDKPPKWFHVAVDNSSGGQPAMLGDRSPIPWHGSNHWLRPSPLNDEDTTRTNLTSCVFLSDGQRVALGFYEGPIEIRNSLTGDLIKRFKGDGKPVHHLSVSPDLTMAAATYERRPPTPSPPTLRLIHLQDQERPLDATGFHFPGQFSNSGQYFAAASSSESERHVRLWNRDRPNETVILECDEYEIDMIVFSPNDRYLATGGWKQVLNVWSLPEGNLVSSIGGFTGGFRRATFTPDEKLILSMTYNFRLNLIDVQSGQRLLSQGDYELGFAFPLLSLDGNHLTLNRWTSTNGPEPLELWNLPSLSDIDEQSR